MLKYAPKARLCEYVGVPKSRLSRVFPWENHLKPWFIPLFPAILAFFDIIFDNLYVPGFFYISWRKEMASFV